jgi:hypothetical protein
MSAASNERNGAQDRMPGPVPGFSRHGRRRPAVVDDSGRLLGLLCLKKDGTDYCSDEGVRDRAQHATQPGRRLAQA